MNKQWWIDRLREPSTYRGLIWLATALGVTLKPEVWEQITAVGMALAGLMGVLTSEAPKNVSIHLLPFTESSGQGRVAGPVSANADSDAASVAEIDHHARSET